MNRMVLAVVGALALATVARATGTQGSVSKAGGTSAADSGLAHEVQPALSGFEDAWNRHDPQALAAAFAEDGVLINPRGRVARGRAEIRQLFEDEQLRGPMRGTRLTGRVTSVRQVAPGLAFVDQEVTVSGAKDSSGQVLPDERLHAALLLVRRGGTWQALEARPYVLMPSGGPRVAAREGPARATPRPGRTPPPSNPGVEEEPTRILDIEDTAHVGP
jgi:uncharacterized protein (TIGR02246 family)